MFYIVNVFKHGKNLKIEWIKLNKKIKKHATSTNYNASFFLYKNQ